jgi:peptidyl-tRNA hydrolase
VDSDLAGYVLGPLSKAEKSTLEELAPTLVKCVETWLRDGPEKAMNLFNRKRPPPTEEE